MFTKKEYKALSFILFFWFLIIFAGNVFAQAPIPSGDQNSKETSISADSVKAKIESKINFYESQLNQNNEVIHQLEKELDERKKLNERLSAAVLVSKEILTELILQKETSAIK